jgi:DNA-binding transcriptional ArsR family regulator
MQEGLGPELRRPRTADIDKHELDENGSNGGAPSTGGGSPAAQLAQLGRALGHPLRVEILTALLDREESSPRELAGELGEPLGTVSYHVRYLVSLEMLELQRMVPRRGAVQHFYSLKDELRRLLPAAAAVLAEPSTAQSEPAAERSGSET